MKINIKQNDKIDVNINNQEMRLRIGTQKVNIGTDDYELLNNLPSINDITLIGNKSLDDLDIQIKGEYPDESITNQEIEDMLNNFA